MTEETTNLVLEMLRGMRDDMATIKDKISNIELRLTSTEGHVSRLYTSFASLHADNVIMHERIDGIDKRIGRIARRLELTSA